jgi:sulfate adenylyltransferase subunit 1 (EFTu-like GTPase family)
MDLVGFSQERFEAVRGEITAFLARLDITPSFVVPVSGTGGDNFASRSERMPWYTGQTILDALDALEKDKDIREKPLRMPVQDLYRRGDRNIVAGRIESGRLAGGDGLTVFPEQREAEIAQVLEFGKERRSAVAGESIGLTLSGDGAVGRGDVLSSSDNVPRLDRRLAASLFWMSPKPFTLGETLTLRANTQERQCVIKEIRRRIDSSTLDTVEEQAHTLSETEVGEVVIEVDRPLAFELFSFIPEMGRFVLEKGNDIVAGGIITHGL